MSVKAFHCQQPQKVHSPHCRTIGTTACPCCHIFHAAQLAMPPRHSLTSSRGQNDRLWRLFVTMLLVMSLWMLGSPLYHNLHNNNDGNHGGAFSMLAQSKVRRKTTKAPPKGCFPMTLSIDPINATQRPPRPLHVSVKLIHPNNTTNTSNDTTATALSEKYPSFSIRHARSRIILFQRNGGSKLHEFLTHHSQVLDDIVVINHLPPVEEDTEVEEDSHATQRTLHILQQWSSASPPHQPRTERLSSNSQQQQQQLQVHVWQCHGSFRTEKDRLWSQVIRTYATHSDFVIPLDLDEFMAVHDEFDKDDHDAALVWNKAAWERELTRLDNDTVVQGKPIKMETSWPIPLECGIRHHGYASLSSSSVHISNSSMSDAARSQFHQSDWCQLQFVGRRLFHHGRHTTSRTCCLDKNLFAGKDFVKTDTGNHLGATHLYPLKSPKSCFEKKLEDRYSVSHIVLIHTQSLTMNDWMLHGLRGAADAGFNSFDVQHFTGKKGQKKQKQQQSSHEHFQLLRDCQKGMQSVHYCEKWNAFVKSGFSPYALRKQYLEQMCKPKLLRNLYNVQGVTAASCVHS